MRRIVPVAVVLAGVFAAPAAAAEVNLAGPGFVPLTVADGVDPGSVRLAGREPLVTSVDVAGDTVLRFDKRALGLTADTTSLPVTGRRYDGSPYRASEPVTPTVVLEVKTADADAVRSRFPDAQLEPLTPAMPEWHRVTLPADVDVDATLRTLRGPGGVKAADPAPEPAPPPATSDFTSMQSYLRPAPVGIDADFSRADARARGAGVRIADLEYYWTSEHEDLQLTPANDLGGTAFPQYTAFGDEHGTAVFGEMAAKDNGYGVTGGVPAWAARSPRPCHSRSAARRASARSCRGRPGSTRRRPRRP
jgi:hypothetical protein